MADPSLLPPPASPPGQRATMRRHLRTTSLSPTRQRPGDALLSRLSPTSAVEALRVPSGDLKACLDDASASEQHFAMRTAVASKKIHDWLDELSGWPWPKESTSAGFEMPPAKRRKTSGPPEANLEQGLGQGSQPTVEPQVSYLGSLPANDVIHYEVRVEQIQKDMDALDLEEIKFQVLHHHIMPLSRPGTPFSDAGMSVASSISYTKMEDITAVITAITVQALPNLTRLSRLLNTWSVRIIVLKKVPSVLAMIADAEVALESGWNAIRLEATAKGSMGNGSSATLVRKDFEVMHSVLRQKVAQPGRDLDFMLDALEGKRDTLPDDWLDRMDAVEKNYAEWVATAERRVREGELSEIYGPPNSDALPSTPQTPQPKVRIQPPSPTKDRTETKKPSDVRILVKEPSNDIPGSVNQVLDISKSAAHQKDVDSGVAVEDPSLDFGSENVGSRGSAAGRTVPDLDGSAERHDGQETKHALSELDHNIVRVTPAESLAPSPHLYRKASPDAEAEYSFLESVNEEDEEDELDLPPARFVPRKGSHESLASTVLHDPVSELAYSDNSPFREESVEHELPRLPDPDEPFSSDALSPPSSPPLRYKPRTTSVSFNEIPEISELPEEEEVTPPRSPFEPADVYDPESSFDYGTQTPSQMSVISEGGDDLHQQIRAVLKNIPNKIRLSTKPSAINLNPPDLQLPSRPKARSSEPFRRSGSALSTRSTMSSRSGTPSWLLAPARAPRPHSRAQDAKTYYLSRSPNEAPMKLLVRCVGENGERVMVRVGGGWADLGEYLKEYAIHHSSRSKGEGKVEVKDSSTLSAGRLGSSPPSRPGSALDTPMTPLAVRKTRKSVGEEGSSRLPATPMTQTTNRSDTPSSDASNGSYTSRAATNPNSSILGMSGPHPKKARALSEESRQWVEDVKNKVRTASGEQRNAQETAQTEGKFGEMGKVGGTKRLFRKSFA
ncbi:uncharacterized protein JN550_005172 [Neoarthrinium moseri]|uniref:uncharacterized protein n=1 Tax=Neoarthrinium moseri TaxID=1658444 RepID=UPI001FDB10AE|nr:uncharacterized protein JN550_005172 [Neoarthrinium moseri]KAI1870629.1 hypothetical protein JN550_005172 [Neoarthrinium moseri]